MLCSVLIPSRGRFERLKNCIQSIIDASQDQSRIEFLIRFDDDDTEYMLRVEELEALPNTKVFCGPRGAGWSQTHEFLNQLSDSSTGKWVWVMNDDVVVTSESEEKWDTQLAQVPTEGFIVQPGIHQLGGSDYGKHEGGPFPIVPRNCWKKTNPVSMPFPADTGLHELCIKVLRWKTKYLEGVRAWHQRDHCLDIAKHRQ